MALNMMEDTDVPQPNMMASACRGVIGNGMNVVDD